MGVADKGRRTSLLSLRLRIKQGVNLAIHDHSGSDPCVFVMMAKENIKIRFIGNNVNPEWNESVYDHDSFTKDDRMKDAKIDIREYMKDVKINLEPRNAVKDLDLKLTNIECDDWFQNFRGLSFSEFES
ncbi:hypothetical protein WN943_001386 [Citrus x changshan-huyou]|uniref:protein C2-DOMAIN ABA-RELATED 4-like n=1 Tax=Citrus clementina TaxID=85681 RepID=UPI000763B4F6|nr:protein C2-DOMAIN ABA-RELATED 4-like [Citrus x clementina]